MNGLPSSLFGFPIVFDGKPITHAAETMVFKLACPVCAGPSDVTQDPAYIQDNESTVFLCERCGPVRVMKETGDIRIPIGFVFP